MIPPTRIVIFARAPVPGAAKTRLIPALGAEGAARLAADMLSRTVRSASGAGLGMPQLCVTPSSEHSDWDGHRPETVQMTDQGEGDLGDRLARATRRVMASGARVLLIGTDCPDLDSDHLRNAAINLVTHDAVMHPARDGGYVLLGLRRFDASLFRDIAWSTSSVAAATIARIAALGWSLHLGETLKDIDEPADLTADLLVKSGPDR